MSPQKVLDHYVTQSAAARAAGVTQPAVAGWVKAGRVPPLSQLRLQHESRGVLKADQKILKRP